MFFRKKPSFEESLQQLQAKRARFNVIIGGWPAAIHNPQEGLEVRKLWNEALKEAKELAKQRPDSVEARIVLADLLRMGHNIDVAGAGKASHDLLEALCQANPDHFEAHYTLAMLYVSIDPNASPLAERLFLKAEALATPKIIPNIYQGLGFACVYQDKIPEAIAYFEKYLQLLDNAGVRELLDALKSGKKPRKVFQPLPNDT
ncbi:MAG: hypothetical protein ABI700_26245 [Chloroflexota bacterium]